LTRAIITLILTLTVFCVSFGQNFKKDIKGGLYLWSLGLVIQQTTDSLKIVQLRVSKSHFYKVADVVNDSITKEKMLPESDPMWATIKPADTYRLIRPSKIVDILELSKSRFSIIFAAEKGFNSANFIKRDFGYEMYFSNHDVTRKKVKESIKRDTATYFMLYAFTLDDLRNLKAFKNFNNMNPTETEALATAVQECAEKNVKLFDRNKNFGILFDDPMGIIAGRELLIKSLLELRYYPLIDSNDPDFIFDKMKPFLKRKR
jgi:hypothetical protein